MDDWEGPPPGLPKNPSRKIHFSRRSNYWLPASPGRRGEDLPRQRANGQITNLLHCYYYYYYYYYYY